MNNHIYTTKAIVLKSSNVGEANKLYFLFTKDFGLIIATAQGIRLEKSKLKGHLQDLNISNVSLVKGRDFWRIVSVESESRPNFLKDQDKMNIIKNIFSLLLRLINGEEKNEALFEVIEKFYQFLLEQDIKEGDFKNLESLTVLRVLYNLGYFKEHSELREFAENENLSLELLQKFDLKRKIAIVEINSALKHTQL